jgi:NitT/TauT family transport system ATP-binding protein
MLQLDTVTLRYDTPGRMATATDRVSLAVGSGERVALLGPSGCGKTSLLKAVAGFIRPAEGTITFHGRPVRAPGPDRIMVFQEFDQLLPWKTVLGNVMFALAAVGGCSRDEARTRAAAAIDRVGLADAAGAFPHTLSGGMKQRAAIARAMALKPDILLMDEPFAALDGLTRSAMQDELLRIWRQTAVAVLFVTHSIEEALVIGERIIVMSPHPGTIRAELPGLTGADRASPAFADHSEHIRRLIMDGAP